MITVESFSLIAATIEAIVEMNPELIDIIEQKQSEYLNSIHPNSRIDEAAFVFKKRLERIKDNK